MFDDTTKASAMDAACDLDIEIACDLDIEIELEAAETSYSFSEPRPQ